jgi:hypothetical protein
MRDAVFVGVLVEVFRDRERTGEGDRGDNEST